MWSPGGSQQPYSSVYQAVFGMVTPEQTTKQPSDPNASLLLTNARRQFFAIVYYINMLCMKQTSRRHHLQLSDALASTFLIASVA